MNRSRSWIHVSLAALLCGLCLCADPAAPYHSNLKDAEPGKLPAEFMVLGGTLSVREADGKKVLELTPEPLETGGFLFGPPSPAGEVAARIWSAASGKRFPQFGVGTNDPGGYKLLLLPGQNRLELRRGDETRAAVVLAGWKSGSWTRFRLHVAMTDGKCRVEGKCWPDGSHEPQAWSISLDDAAPPPAGRASAWGIPFSGQPIRFDDLGFTPAP